MRIRVFAVALAIALPVTAVPAPAQLRSASGQDLTPEERGAYVAVAGASSLYEIRAAEIAVEKAQRPEVKEFAQTLLTEHRESNARLEETARAVGLDALLPPAMMPVHWELLRRLERSSRRRFDDLYLDQQIEAHEVAVELHRNFAANGNDTQLKAFAEATLPMVTSHLERARSLNR